MKDTQKRGRKSSILLSSAGRTLSIKEWARITNPEDPDRAESGIRDRIRHRNAGKRYSDNQIIYGVSRAAPDELPVRMGLPILVKSWLQDVFTNELSDLLVNAIEPKITAYVAAEVRKANILAQESRPHLQKPLAAQIVEQEVSEPDYEFKQRPNDTAVLLIIQQWLEKKGIEDTWFEDNALSDDMLSLWSGGNSINLQRCYDITVDTRKKIALDTGAPMPQEVLSATVSATPVEVPQPTKIREFENPFLFEFMRKHERLTPPAELCELYPEDPNWITEWYKAPAVRAINEKAFYFDENIFDRALHNYAEYYNFQRYEELNQWKMYFKSEQIRRWHRFACYDIAFRCMWGVVDHFSFNQVMEVFFIGWLFKHKASHARHQLYTQLFTECVLRLHELGVSALDVVAMVDKHPVLGSRDDFDNTQVRLVLERVTLPEGELEWHEHEGRKCKLYSTDKETLIEFDDDSQSNLAIIKELVSNYGRNRFWWPEQYREFTTEEWHLVPCDVYLDPLRPRDYSVYDGAPVVDEGTDTFLVIEDVDRGGV